MGSTPSLRPSTMSSRFASMNATTSCVGGRAPRCSYVNCAWLGGCRKRHRLMTGDGLGGAEGGEDGIGETSPQQSQTGGLVLAPGLLLGQIGMARADPTGLGDSDHVESTVGRSVAAAVET